MSVDLSKVKIGDAVTVYGTVRGLHSDTLNVQVGRYCDGQIVEVEPKEIATHEPKPITRGDQLRRLGVAGSYSNADKIVTVLHVEPDGYLVRWPDGSKCFCPLADWERV